MRACWSVNQVKHMRGLGTDEFPPAEKLGSTAVCLHQQNAVQGSPSSGVGFVIVQLRG